MLQSQIVTDDVPQGAIPAAFDESNNLFQKIRKSLEEAPYSLTESDIWEMLAHNNSEEWDAARNELRRHEADLQERLHPHNVPLGLIGAAMDAGELDQSRNRHSMALAMFTVINEDLRQKAELKAMMKSLCDLRGTLQESHDLSMAALKLTSHFANAKQKPSKTPQQPETPAPPKLQGLFNRMRQAFTG